MNANGGLSNKFIGAHSGEISNDLPDYAVQVLRNNADGTSAVKMYKQFSDGNLSVLKSSTLFPGSWSDADIMSAIQDVGAPANSIGTRISDGANAYSNGTASTLYRGQVNGVNMEVIKIGNRVTSAYPTGGGFPSLDLFGLTPVPPVP